MKPPTEVRIGNVRFRVLNSGQIQRFINHPLFRSDKEGIGIWQRVPLNQLKLRNEIRRRAEMIKAAKEQNP
jgi:hypothetical protein